MFRRAGDFNLLAPDALGRGVAPISTARVNLLKHRVINIDAERRVNCLEVDAQLVRCQLDACGFLPSLGSSRGDPSRLRSPMVCSTTESAVLVKSCSVPAPSAYRAGHYAN